MKAKVTKSTWTNNMEKYIYNIEQLIKTLVGKEEKFNEKISQKKYFCGF